MSRTAPLRRVVAAIAVYAVFLQALLPAAFAIAAPYDLAICAAATAVGRSHGAPAQHDGAIPDCCGVMCCGPLLGVAPEAAGRPLRLQGQIVSSALIHARIAPPLHRGPQSPRAPPAG